MTLRRASFSVDRVHRINEYTYVTKKMGHFWALEKFRSANLLYSLRRSLVMHRVAVALNFALTARSVRSPEMGVDRFRRALRTIALVFVVSLIVVSAASLIIYRRELGKVASGQDDLYAAIK